MSSPQERYKRNSKTISLEEQQVMAGTTITVIGCGGLGGFIIEGQDIGDSFEKRKYKGVKNKGRSEELSIGILC